MTNTKKEKKEYLKIKGFITITLYLNKLQLYAPLHFYTYNFMSF